MITIMTINSTSRIAMSSCGISVLTLLWLLSTKQPLKQMFRNWVVRHRVLAERTPVSIVENSARQQRIARIDAQQKKNQYRQFHSSSAPESGDSKATFGQFFS
jgi:hypothetical protein